MRRGASGPETTYLYSGETSMTAAASRIALYSMSWKSAYTAAAWYPDHSPQASRSFIADVRGWKAVPTLTVVLLRSVVATRAWQAPARQGPGSQGSSMAGGG